MKLPSVFVAALCISHLANGQSPGSSVGSGSTRPPTYLQELFRDRVKPTRNAGIAGSPFLNDDWVMASIQLADDRVFDSIYIKLNVYDDKVHYLDDKGEELEVAIRVKQVTITDSNSSWLGAIFRTGYAGAENTFFQVLEDGKRIQLVKKIKATVWLAKAVGEEDKKTFQVVPELFFSINNEVFRQSKTCHVVAEVVEKYEAEVRQFVSANEIKCNREGDMRRLVVYYNSL